MAGDTRTERGDRRPTPDLADRRSNLPSMWRVCVVYHTLYGKHTFFQRGIYYIIRNDYVRMYIVEHHYTRGDLRLVRFYKIKYKLQI